MDRDRGSKGQYLFSEYVVSYEAQVRFVKTNQYIFVVFISCFCPFFLCYVCSILSVLKLLLFGRTDRTFHGPHINAYSGNIIMVPSAIAIITTRGWWNGVWPEHTHENELITLVRIRTRYSGNPYTSSSLHIISIT